MVFVICWHSLALPIYDTHWPCLYMTLIAPVYIWHSFTLPIYDTPWICLCMTLIDPAYVWHSLTLSVYDTHWPSLYMTLTGSAYVDIHCFCLCEHSLALPMLTFIGSAYVDTHWPCQYIRQLLVLPYSMYDTHCLCLLYDTHWPYKGLHMFHTHWTCLYMTYISPASLLA